MKADLHMHSINSDGHKTVNDLAKLARQNNVDIMALTDHDTVQGLNNLLKEENNGLKVICGIELSTKSNGEAIHLLGYFRNNDFKNKPILEFLDEQKRRRDERCIKMCEKLKEHFDIEINPYKLINEAKGVIARPHIAEAIVNAGYDYSFKYIFDNIIGDDSKAYIPSTRISTAEGVKLLRESDMVIVIAHPGLYKKNDINDLIKLGVDGIECIYPLHTDEMVEYFIKVAKENNLLITSGSDYHKDNDYKHGAVGQIKKVDNYDLYIENFLNKFK